MENINAQSYIFNRLVIAMHESIQANAKVKMLQSESTGYYFPKNKHMGKYSRNPRNVRRDIIACRSKGGTPRNFHEARRMGVCFKCLSKWEPKHKCNPGAVRQNERDRVKSGESQVHIVSCLIDAMEGDGNHSQEEPVQTGHTEDHKHLDEFESYHAENDDVPYDDTSESSIDDAIMTEHISSAISPCINADEQDFPQGD